MGVPQSRQAKPQSRHFGTLTIGLDTTRQRLKEIKVGVVDLRGHLRSEEISELAAWIVQDRIAMATGYWGNFKGLVGSLAETTGAIYKRPVFQGVMNDSGEPVVHPSYFLFFGFHHRIKIPDPFPYMKRNWVLGADIMEELIPIQEIPWWGENQRGSAFVPNLGSIVMKKVAWHKWIPNMFQTCLWLGTSTPSYKSQRSQMQKDEAGKGKGKGKKNEACKGTKKGKGQKKGKGKEAYKDAKATSWFDLMIS